MSNAKSFKISTAGAATFVSSDSMEPLETLVIAILDGSGSMGEPSARPGGAAAAESTLFNRMDIVKHATNTVAAVAGSCPNASLALIRFSDAADTVLPITQMNAAGVTKAQHAVNYLEPGGGTNIWAGLGKALDLAESFAKSKPEANIHIILLTDGEPTPDYLPMGGIQAALSRRLGTMTAKPVISSFGFGFNLDSKLLETICVAGNGTYGYIPDCSMAGTVFINYCAAAFTTVATNVSVNGQYVGNILAGSKRTLYAASPVGSTAAITYGNSVAAAATVSAASENDGDNAKVVARLRADLAAASHSSRMAANDFTGLRALKAWIGDPDGGFRTAIMADLEHPSDDKGQLTRAISREDWFNSWGLNHLLSYSRGLASEQCVNFKEAALQFYAAPAFAAVRDRGNDLFDRLPMPKASLVHRADPVLQAAVRTGTVNMATLNNAAGGCFTGDSLIEMVGGSVPVNTVKAGDRLASGDKVRCVVRTVLEPSDGVKMLELSTGLTITAWHPVRTDSTSSWLFPADLTQINRAWLHHEPVSMYYTFVMESGHVMRIGGYDVIGLGHHFTGPVIGHAFFGTDAVIDFLKTYEGWSEGTVTLKLSDWPKV
uniref:VWFA domain-containing protein n=1 Tax=viral metagenome TaxID=1070528 RepID=A0A6C0DTF9_9ZZZZ